MDFESMAKAKKILTDSGVIVKEIVYLTDPEMRPILRNTESQVVLCFLSRTELLELFTLRKAREIQKLWMTLPVNGEKLSAADARQLLSQPSEANVIVLQEQIAEIPEFRDYFLHILR